MKLVLLDDAGYTINSWTPLPPVESRIKWEILATKVMRSIEDYQASVADKDYDEAQRRKR